MKTKKLCCQINAKAKRLKTLDKVEKALKVLSSKKKVISVANLAIISGISKTWFYDEEEIKELFRGRCTEEVIQKLFDYFEQEKKLIACEYKDLSETRK